MIVVVAVVDDNRRVVVVVQGMELVLDIELLLVVVEVGVVKELVREHVQEQALDMDVEEVHKLKQKAFINK